MYKPISHRLRHRVDIEAFSVTQDSETGAMTESWVAIAEGVAAEIVPVSGREFVAGAAIQSLVNTRITIRYDAAVAAGMRIVHGSTIYNIRAVLPDPSLRHHLTLMCQAGSNEG